MTLIKKSQLYSLRSRLVLMAVAVVTLPMLLATLFAFFSQKEQIDHSLTRELKASISATMLYYHGLHDKIEMIARATANDNTCKTTLRLGVLPQLQNQINTLAQEYGLDLLLVTDFAGRVVALYPPAGADTDTDLARHPLIIEALQGKMTTTAVAEQHPLLTRAAAPGPEKGGQETPLLLESALPIMVRDTQVGTILAGIRLSGNEGMMQAMQQNSGADRTLLIMNGRVVASSSQHPLDPVHTPPPGLPDWWTRDGRHGIAPHLHLPRGA